MLFVAFVLDTITLASQDYTSILRVTLVLTSVVVILACVMFVIRASVFFRVVHVLFLMAGALITLDALSRLF